ncbi:MAG: DUF309 domain-containing protein [Chloroflexota bacterium]
MFIDHASLSSEEKSTLEIDKFHVEQYIEITELLDPGEREAIVVNRPGEPIRGEDASTFAKIVQKQPALIVFDLDNDRINWKRWLPVLKSSPASRRFPIVAYKREMDGETRRLAKSRGGDIVGPRAKVLKDLPQIAANRGRLVDHVAIASACEEALSDYALKGLELFNVGEYFECHEELEHAWNEDMGAGRDLYRGILQVAVAYLQIERGNYNGAVKMMLRVKQWLDPMPDICRTINVGKLRREANLVHETILELGRDKIGEFDRSLFRPVEYGV